VSGVVTASCENLSKAREMYDLNSLKTVDDCRRVMKRAKKQGRPEVYSAVFKRQCELVGLQNEDPEDPLVRRFYETLAAYEQLLTEKNNKKTPAGRTRQKVANKGVHQSLIDWASGKVETNGFHLLVEKGLPEHTAEYVVMQFEHRFPPEVVELARNRLAGQGIRLP
jgi:hypothetical protein